MRATLITRVMPACFALTLLLARGADAQPAQPQPDENAPDEPVTVVPGEDDTLQPGEVATPQPGPAEQAPTQPVVPDPYVRPADPAQAAGDDEDDDSEPIRMPFLFDAPTGHLLPAGIILTEGGVDTSGSFSADIRVGLGDVAEFGVGTNALINVIQDGGQPEAIPAYPMALFKMGIGENLLFRHQPALSLGFRKSFEVPHDDRKSRAAQLYLVASKSLGSKLHLHVGGMFWDASIKREDDTEVSLHDAGAEKQLRAFGGIEIDPLPRSQILLELYWVPQFALRSASGSADAISLEPSFAWGVRYELADWVLIESGVRLPNIQDVNLIDAQIFGQIRFVTRRFRSFLEGIH